MIMKKYIKHLTFNLGLLFIVLAMSSCLTGGLDDLPAYSDAEITNVKFEHRWKRLISNEAGQDIYQLAVVSMTTDCKFQENTINCTITVPETGNPSMFTEDIRNEVSLDKIVGMVSISTAATIKPIGDSSKFGDFGDYTVARKYLVTAADGTKKEWTIVCVMVK